jgi:thioesterase domain-containing protein
MITLPREAIAELEQTLHAEIPLTRAMGVRVVRADHNGLVLGAALAPNLNHKQTAFGGSLNSLATLACWGLIQLLVRDYGQTITVVIQESSVQFLKPVTHDFEALCPPPPPAVHEKFLRILERKGRARLELEATIHSDGDVALRFRGQFVAYDRARFQRFESAAVV